eukprot:TRINITY_DN3798_c0_g1_i1.p1 TRINITY_DN3798_c0_g1~~TRINITY_DN3798_c0_g1_i1.p1  ORF type:complete len:530 (+),score=201.36 TRINITY_DN3798_c0_g1_i1:55-1644(+)
MFSAMKKLRHGGGAAPQPPSPIPKSEEPHPMSISLQKKFAKGINYNMKLLIRGDRMAGKSSLFLRLQGLPFPKDPGYTATEEISVASIQWNYNATDDVVKVEVWDVVDRGKKRPALTGLKLASNDTPPPQPALDAEFVDVYKGAHGVVLLYDMTKSWTFDYVKRELPKIPMHLPVLILANFADQCHHRAVTKDQALGLIEELFVALPSRDRNTVRYTESSMRNGFGLKFLHKFLNLPFLHLQRASLLTQLQMNDRDLLATIQELDLLCDSEESSYESFSENATKIRRQVAESQGPPPTVDVVLGAQKPPIKEESPLAAAASKALPNTSVVNSPPPLKSPTPTTASPPVIQEQLRSPDKKTPSNVDDFIPESPAGIDSFLMDEESSQKTNNSSHRIQGEAGESSDDEGVNHLVAGFNEEVVIDDYDTLAVNETLQDSSSSDSESPQKKSPLPRRISPKPPSSQNNYHEEENNVVEESSVQDSKRTKKKKSKKSSRGSRKKSEEEERNALEEFLNGTPEEMPRTSNAYEEF